MAANTFNGYNAREYFWGHSFTNAEPTKTWTFEEEDEDTDYLTHTLYLKQVCLGLDAPTDEPHLLQVEAKDYDGKERKIVIAHLNSSTTPSVHMDLSFDNKTTCTFRLVQGTGPLDLTATHLVEFPEEFPDDPTEEDDSGDEAEVEEEIKNDKPMKRKASGALNGQKAKKGKHDTDDDDEEDEDEEEEEEDSEDEEDDEEEEMEEDEEEQDMESSPEMKKKGKKGVVPAKKAVNGKKATPVAGKKAAAAKNGKGKKAKAK